MGKMRRALHADKRDVKLERNIDSPVSAGAVGYTPQDNNLTPSSEAMAAEQVQNFHHILGQLSDDYAQVIRLRSIDRLPFKQVAEEMNRSHDSVTKLWYRAILKFEELLRQSGEFGTDAENK